MSRHIHTKWGGIGLDFLVSFETPECPTGHSTLLETCGCYDGFVLFNLMSRELSTLSTLASYGKTNFDVAISCGYYFTTNIKYRPKILI